MKLLSKRKVLALAGVLAVALLAVVAGAVYFLSSPDFDDFAADYIVDRIESASGGQVVLEAFEADFWQQRFVLEGLSVRSEDGSADRALVEIDRIDLGLNLMTLISRTVDLSNLTLTRPRLYIDIAPDGSTNIPSLEQRPDQGPSSFEVSIGAFNVDGGEVLIGERRVNIDFTLAALDGSFEYTGATGVLSGHLEYEGTVERADRATIPYKLKADFDHAADTVLVHTAELSSGESRVTLQGRVDDVLRSPIGRMNYTGSAHLGFMNYFFTEEDFTGALEIDGDLDFSSDHFSARGHASGERVTVDAWAATGLESDFEYAFPERKLRGRAIEMNALGGRVMGTADIGPLPGPGRRVELNLSYDGIDTVRLRRIYPWDRQYVIHSLATGTLQGWFEGKFRQFEFEGDVNLVPAEASDPEETVALVFGGRTHYEGSPGSLRLTNATARLGETDIEAEGLVDRDHSSLELSLESADLSDLDFLYDGANGSGEFDGTITGPIGEPEIAGQFVVSDYRYGNWDLDRLAGQASLNSGRIALQQVRVLDGGSELVFGGRVGLDGADPDLDIQVRRLHGADLEEFVASPFDGLFNGDIHVASIAPIEASGKLQARNLVYQGRLLGNAQTDFNFDNAEIRLSDLSLERDDAILRASLIYRRASDEISVDLRSSGLTLEELHSLGVPAAFSGTIRDADFTVRGTRSLPQVEGIASVEEVRFRRQYFPRVTVNVGTSGRMVRAQIETTENLTLETEFNAAEDGYPFSGKAEYTDYAIDRLTGMASGSLIATGTASFAGLLGDFSTLTGEGEVTDLTANFQKRVLGIAQPFTFRFDSRRLTLSEIDLSGGATSILLAGTVALSDTAPLNLSINGAVDLSLVAGGIPNIEADGNITLEGTVTGGIRNPELRGLAQLENVSLGHEGLFLRLSSVSGGLFFDGNSVNLTDVRGRAGGGDVSMRGSIGIENLGLGAFDVRLDVSNVRLRDPEGLRTLVSGNLVLHGTGSAPSLEGNLDVLSFSYDERFDRFLELFQDRGPSDVDSPLATLALAIHAQGDRNISIENDLASVEGRLDLDIGGTFGDPALTGHVEISTGFLDFQGSRYRITRGSVDFVDPFRIEPVVDVAAETELRDYRIILGISGRGDEIRLDMRSDPPLPQLEVVSLIAGGRTREELAEDRAAGAALPTSERLFRGGAATILADLLQSRAGSRFGLLDRFRIDPFLVGAENNPVARVTISEQITRDLTITYSQDLSSNRQQIILIEYFLNNDTSFIASRDETGAVGLDIKLRKRFQ